MHMSGHDVGDIVQQWLRSRHQEQLSVCELILMDPDFAEIRPHVGFANIFWTHIQTTGIVGSQSKVHGERIGKTDMGSMLSIGDFSNELPPKEQQFFWHNNFCLRRCQPDYTPDAMVELIRDIGCLAGAIDDKWQLLHLSFNIFEIFAAVMGNCKIVLSSPAHDEESARLLLKIPSPGERIPSKWVGPIDARKAVSEDPQDKAFVDRYVESMDGGFERLNATLTQAIIVSATRF